MFIINIFHQNQKTIQRIEQNLICVSYYLTFLKKKLRRVEKSVALSNLSIYYTCKHIKRSYKNYNFKISAPTWNDKFELPDGSCSTSDIQDYFEYIISMKYLLIVHQN